MKERQRDENAVYSGTHKIDSTRFRETAIHVVSATLKFCDVTEMTSHQHYHINIFGGSHDG